MGIVKNVSIDKTSLFVDRLAGKKREDSFDTECNIFLVKPKNKKYPQDEILAFVGCSDVLYINLVARGEIEKCRIQYSQKEFFNNQMEIIANVTDITEIKVGGGK